MRQKLRLLNLVLIVVFIFSFTACTTPKTATETTTAETIITETTAPETTAKYKIAFMSDRDGNNEIYTINVDGSEQVRLTNNPADDADPSFSPDGSKIVFYSGRDGNYEIYTINVDGSEQTNITNNPEWAN